MPKKGWKATARVRYKWANGVAGTKAFYSQAEADMFAQQLRERAEALQTAVTVNLEQIEATE